MMKRFICQCRSAILVLAFLGLESNLVFAQSSILDVGFRIQKTVNLYLENGISIEYSHKDILFDKLYFGFTYVTSRLGTAWNSNAIPQDNILLSGAWVFRKDRLLRPKLRLNTGYFHANYGHELFDEIPNSSFLLSPEFGVVFDTNRPIKVALTAGHNILTGNGESGPGTLYPLFVQTTVSWDLIKK